MNIERETALLSLQNRIKDARKLIVCDRYISNVNNYDIFFDEIGKVLPSGLELLVLVYRQTEKDFEFRPRMDEYFSRKFPGNNIYFFQTNRIHDRVWIINVSTAFVTGTSFNSIGYNLSFTNDLPQSDFRKFWAFISRCLGEEFTNLF